FSRKESDLACARMSRLFSTAATSESDPVRMRSEFSLNRSFQSATLIHSPDERYSTIFSTSPFRTTGRIPTLLTLANGTVTLALLAAIFSMWNFSTVAPMVRLLICSIIPTPWLGYTTLSPMWKSLFPFMEGPSPRGRDLQAVYADRRIEGNREALPRGPRGGIPA